MSARRFYVHDRAATQASQLTSWSHLNPRFGIIDRTTNLPVDDASSRYEATQAAQGWNAGVYGDPEPTTTPSTTTQEGTK